MDDQLWEKRMRMQQHQQNRVARKERKHEAVRLAKIEARRDHLDAYGIPPARPPAALRVQSDSVLALRQPTRLQATAARHLPAGLNLPPPAILRVRDTMDVVSPPPPKQPSPRPQLPRQPTSPLRHPAENMPDSDSSGAVTPAPKPAPAPAPRARERVRTPQRTPDVRYSLPPQVHSYFSKGY